MTRIIIPAYNEARNLPRLVSRLATVLTRQPYTITVVNDGSDDETATVLQQLASRYPLTVSMHEKNRGVAAAFRTGITTVVAAAAPDDVIIIMEGDGTSTPGLVPAMVRRIEQGADLVIASRYRSGGGYRRFPLKRLVLSRGANLVFRLLFPIPGVRDYSIFFRAYRARSLQRALRHHGERLMTVATFFANIELLLNLRPWLKQIDELPLRYDYGLKRGKSGMNVWSNLRSYLAFIARYALRRRV